MSTGGGDAMTEQQPAPLGQEQEAAIRERWLISAFPTIAQGRHDVRCLLTEIDRLRAALAEAEAKRQDALATLRHQIDHEAQECAELAGIITAQHHMLQRCLRRAPRGSRSEITALLALSEQFA